MDQEVVTEVVPVATVEAMQADIEIRRREGS